MYLLFAAAYNQGALMSDKDNYYDPNRVVWEVNDPQQYLIPQDPNIADAFARRYRFGYEQIIPVALEHHRYRYMQEDLNRFFGDLYGITARVEKRRVKCMVLQRTEQLDTTQSGKKKVVDDERQVYFRNYPFQQAVSMLKNYYLKDLFRQFTLPFVDRTGYKGPVNLQLSRSIHDLQDLKRAFLENGIELVEAERELNMLVITEGTAGK